MVRLGNANSHNELEIFSWNLHCESRNAPGFLDGFWYKGRTGCMQSLFTTCSEALLLTCARRLGVGTERYLAK